MKTTLFNQNGEETGTIELPEAVFGLKWNADLVHQIVTSQMANRRINIAHAKDRSEVRGGGKKPWRQKGTGRARHGSIRSPIWKGGGVTHGPRKEKNLKKNINRKMAKKALFTVLSAKAKDKEVIVLDDLKFSEPKTKLGSLMFLNFSRKNDFSRILKGNAVLVVLPEKSEITKRVLRNLPYVSLDEARNLNAYDVMRYKYVLFPKSTIDSFPSV